MNTIFTMYLVIVSVLVVGGKKFEAIEGQNATISFDIDEVEKADEVRITCKDDKKEYPVLKAQKPWVYDDPQYPGVSLILGEGCVSVIIQNISISRSGNYTARVFIRENVSEETATLLVNKAPVSSTTSPPHSSPSPKPPRSADHRGRYGLIPVFIIIIIIILSVCSWKHGMIPCFKRKNRDPVPVIVCPST